MALGLLFARAYLARVALTVTLLAVLVSAVTLVENAGELAREAVSRGTGVRLAAAAALEYAYQLLPIAALCALLAVGTQLARRGELLALAAAGRPPWRTWAPFVAATALLALLAGAAGEAVLPWAIAARARLQRDEIGHPDPLAQFYSRRVHWYRDGAWLLYLPQVDAAAQQFCAPSIYRLDGGRIVAVTQARRLRHLPSGWCLDDARTFYTDSAVVQRDAELPLALQVAPRDLFDITGSPRQMGLSGVGALIARRSRAGLDTTAHRLEWHSRLSTPCATLLLACLALPWALDVDRRRQLAPTLGAGVVAIVAWLGLTQLLRLLALAHAVPVLLGAWGAHALGALAMPLSVWAQGQRRG